MKSKDIFEQGYSDEELIEILMKEFSMIRSNALAEIAAHHGKRFNDVIQLDEPEKERHD